jgi:hypothetical protein
LDSASLNYFCKRSIEPRQVQDGCDINVDADVEVRIVVVLEEIKMLAAIPSFNV